MQVIDVPVWTMEETERYAAERVGLHKQAEQGDEIECTEEERWYSGTTYALMKDGGKRAKKVASTVAELGDIPDGHYVEERPGVSRRCEGYCEVAPFCKQYQAIKSMQPEETQNDVDF